MTEIISILTAHYSKDEGSQPHAILANLHVLPFLLNLLRHGVTVLENLALLLPQLWSLIFLLLFIICYNFNFFLKVQTQICDHAQFGIDLKCSQFGVTYCDIDSFMLRQKSQNDLLKNYFNLIKTDPTLLLLVMTIESEWLA